MRSLITGWTLSREPREIKTDEVGRLLIAGVTGIDGETPGTAEGELEGSLATTEAETIVARGMSVLTIITDGDSTATVSRVDSADADAHTTGTENQFTVAENNRFVLPVDWPFYRISSADGETRWALT